MDKEKILEAIENMTVLELNELVEACEEKFGVSADGVDKYIERLESARFAPDREDVLGKLSQYKHLSKRFENDPAAIKSVKEIEKNDIKWVKKFGTSLKKKNDPISRYLKSAKKYVRGRKARRTFLVILILLIVAAGAVVALDFLEILPILPF